VRTCINALAHNGYALKSSYAQFLNLASGAEDDIGERLRVRAWEEAPLLNEISEERRASAESRQIR